MALLSHKVRDGDSNANCILLDYSHYNGFEFGCSSLGASSETLHNYFLSFNNDGKEG